MIELHKQFKVPIAGLDGLIPIAEEIEVKKKQKKIDRKKAFQSDSESEEEEFDEVVEEDAQVENKE